MPKEKNRTNKVSPTKKGRAGYKSSSDEDIIVDTELEDSNEGEDSEEELDPEVLAALNVKKNLKLKQNNGVDYIPELERGDEDFTDLDEDM